MKRVLRKFGFVSAGAMLVAISVAGCGDDDEDGGSGGKAGSGGSGGSTGGSGGSTGGTGGSTGGSGGSTGGTGGSTGGTGGTGGSAGVDGGAGTGGSAGVDGGAGTGGSAGVDGGAGTGGSAGGDAGCADGGTPCNDVCVDMQTDPANCGTCEHVCGSANTTSAGPSCANGNCVIPCAEGFGHCDTDDANGCETNTDESLAHCGGCNMPCTGDCNGGQCDAVCGNGTIEAPEECDDGGTLNLDGCSSTCTYEMVQRLSNIVFKRGTAPSYCTPDTNGLGEAFTDTGIGAVNQGLVDAVTAGTLNVLHAYYGLEDPTGQNDASLGVGLLVGGPDLRNTSCGPPGGLDCWFQVPPNQLDTSQQSLQILTGGIGSGVLMGAVTASQLPLLGSISITMAPTRMRATVNAATSVPAPPPTAAQLAAGLQWFETVTAMGTDDGVCGNITIGSLAAIPARKDFTTTGDDPNRRCRPAIGAAGDTCTASLDYTYCGDNQPVSASCNSLLDMLVGGCKVNPLCSEAIAPTQPDVNLTGGAVVLVNDPATHKVVVPEPIANAVFYSAWYGFTSQRLHITNSVPTP